MPKQIRTIQAFLPRNVGPVCEAENFTKSVGVSNETWHVDQDRHAFNVD